MHQKILESYEVGHPIFWIGTVAAESNVIYMVVGDYKKSSCEKNSLSWRLIEYDTKDKIVTKEWMRSVDHRFNVACIRQVSLNGEICTIIAVASKFKLHRCCKVSGQNEKANIIYSRADYRITSIAIHPKRFECATGDADGQILLWNGLKGRFTSKLHWHAGAVGCVTYAASGLFLMSGGAEGVLVLWQLENGRRTYFPRLGAALVGVLETPESTSCVVQFANNSLALLSPMSMKTIWKICGLAGEGSELLLGGKLVIDPKMNTVVLNDTTKSGTLQFYNMESKKKVAELVVLQRNHIGDIDSTESNPINRTDHAVFSPCGNHLVTVDRSTVLNTCELKFWQYCHQRKQYKISTRVGQPHDDAKITSIVYCPTKDVVVTCGENGYFKIWNKEILAKQTATTHTLKVTKFVWACATAVQYSEKAITATAFSPDGEILTIAYGATITVWNPTTKDLMGVLTYPVATEHVNSLIFGRSTSPYLVASTALGVYVWNLSTCSLWWSYRCKVLAIVGNCRHDCGMDEAEFVLAIAKTAKQGDAKMLGGSHLLYFNDMTSPSPSRIVHMNVTVAAATCRTIEGASGKSTSIVLADASTKLWSVQMSTENTSSTEAQVVEYTNKKKFGAFLNQTSASSASKVKASQPISSTSDLFDAPAHVMPPLSSVYEAFTNRLVNSKGIKTVGPNLNKRKLDEAPIVLPRKKAVQNPECFDDDQSVFADLEKYYGTIPMK